MLIFSIVMVVLVVAMVLVLVVAMVIVLVIGYVLMYGVQLLITLLTVSCMNHNDLLSFTYEHSLDY